jgi:hypothetical protein
VSYNRSDYRHKWALESRTAAVRRDVGLDQIEVLDPSLLLDRVGAQIFFLSDLCGENAVLLQRARRMAFDGAASHHPDTGEPLILLNCGKPSRRRLATLMEELSHLILEHRPSRIERHPLLGFSQRTFDQSQEHEAYDFGAALLLPKERIQRDIKDRQCSLGDIADEHGCSEQLVTYRVRRMRLWNRYLSYTAAA